MIHHVGHPSLAPADLLRDHADEFLGAVDHQLLHRLLPLALDGARDHLGLAGRQLVAFTPHHLDQDRHLQLAATRDLEGVGRAAGLDPDADVGEDLALQSLAQIS